jgi:hypothetical protein
MGKDFTNQLKRISKRTIKERPVLVEKKQKTDKYGIEELKNIMHSSQ